MTTKLNHTIIWCSDPERSAGFLAALLGLPAPVRFARFEVVALDNEVSLDFSVSEGPIQPQHYAFLTSEADFDAIFARIQAQGVAFWADPMRNDPGRINYHDGGRGVYFADPDCHYLEIITRPYGGG